MTNYDSKRQKIFLRKTQRKKFVAHEIPHKIVSYEISEKPRFIGENCKDPKLAHNQVLIVITAIYFKKTGFLGNFVRDNFVGNLMGYKFLLVRISEKSSVFWIIPNFPSKSKKSIIDPQKTII
jgi:hypothetical protein